LGPKFLCRHSMSALNSAKCAECKSPSLSCKTHCAEKATQKCLVTEIPWESAVTDPVKKAKRENLLCCGAAV
jgi:hypothetical protein